MAKEIGDGTTTATILAHAMVRGGVKAVAAELLEDTPGALWSHGSIEASRLRSAPQMTRVVVAILSRLLTRPVAWVGSAAGGATRPLT